VLTHIDSELFSDIVHSAAVDAKKKGAPYRIPLPGKDHPTRSPSAETPLSEMLDSADSQNFSSILAPPPFSGGRARSLS
jgi:hypothetical protein